VLLIGVTGVVLSSEIEGSATMPKFVIERNIPGVGSLTTEEFAGISQKSCSVIREIGPQVQWVESFVTDDKIYCIYIAKDEATVLEHARLGGFPADSVKVVRRMIDPTTAD
jgi:Protein of unknown function (DUF4242)